MAQAHNQAPHLTAKPVAPFGAPCLAAGGIGRYTRVEDNSYFSGCREFSAFFNSRDCAVLRMK